MAGYAVNAGSTNETAFRNQGLGCSRRRPKRLRQTHQMKNRNDEQLLRAWSKDRCEESFGALVERYTDLVFGTAARRMIDRQLAEEVSQNVFITLAKKAGQLKGANGIGGWLFKATVLEAAGVRRSESRRNERMRELKELEDTLRSVGGEAMGGEALEIVDEGLAGLGAADRNVLITRFFNGVSYEKMALASGRSESACRKQVSRAMQKLAELLEDRGVRVSTTVLAAGLGAIMTTRAPAELAGTCASGAIGATAGVAAPGILTIILTAMTTTKITSVLVLGGVLLLVSTGAGYVAGRGDAREEAANAASKASLEETRKSSRKGGDDRSEASPASLRKTSADETRIATILNNLKKKLRGKGWDQAMEAGVPLVAGLMGSDMEKAFAVMSGEKNNSLRQTVQAILYRRWAALDGPAAIDHAMKQEDEFTRKVALGQGVPAWGAVDPQGALAWHQAMMNQDELPVDELTANRMMGAILRGWSQTDMSAAWDRYEALSSDQQRAALSSMDNLVADERYREAMVARVAVIEDEKLRSQVVQEVGEVWARTDPEAAVEWFDTIEFADPMLRLRAGMEIGEEWFEKDAVAAATWLWPMVPEQMQSRFVGQLAQGPFGQDREALNSWLAERGFNVDGTPTTTEE